MHLRELSFTEKQAAEKTHVMILVRGYNADAELQFAYVMVRLDALIKLESKMKNKENFNLEEYGHVIEWGMGNPSTEIMQKMRDEYGFDHASGLMIDSTK